ncbi:MAG: AcrR family transcriptional regulator [Cocleimonas sp.]|jgi:AcrR family transcriptional regulator
MAIKGKRVKIAEEKRKMILASAREVFSENGLEGTSLRAVAAHAGYTPGALYFHFDSKEALYAEVLNLSLQRLEERIKSEIETLTSHEERLYASGLAFFTFYEENPIDLDLGFYLFRGGMKPAGLGRERDIALNQALEDALSPIAEEAEKLGAAETEANLLVVDCFAHATGLLLLLHTGRIRMFNASASVRMKEYVSEKIEQIKNK